jgi:outer membrane protein insertion porin family
MKYSCGRAFLFFLILCFPAVLHPQPVIRSVATEGNQFFSQRQLFDLNPVPVGSLYDQTVESRFRETLTELYHAEGFYSFRIDSVKRIFEEDSSGVEIVFHIHEGVRTLVKEITVSGNRFIPEAELLALVESSSGKPLNVPLLESDIRSILMRYSRSGFPFVKVRSDSIDIDPHDGSSLSVHLVVIEGPRVVLQEIRPEGNTVTSSRLIEREARLTAGEYFDDEKVSRIRRRLERLQLFSAVAEPELYIITETDSSVLRGGLTIRVKEGSSNSFDGILGYVPASPPNSGGYFTGDLFVAFRNLFGTGRKAMVHWKRENELTRELEVQYREPWIAGLPLNAGGTFFQRKQDSLYVKTRIEVRGEFSVTEELTVAGNISTESVYPSADLQQFSVFESGTLSAGGEIGYDTRDNLRNPTGGVRYATAASTGNKRITGPGRFLALAQRRNYSVQKYSVDAEVYVKSFVRQVILIGIHGKKISSSGLEESELYLFGGTTTVRGYRESQFLASQLAWINLEYRFLTGRASSLFGFADGGYYSRAADAVKGIAFREEGIYGYGIGTRVETGLGILNISFALGKGDSFSTGKIHVGIVNDF